MKKKQLNLTSGPILRTLSELALPIMASFFLPVYRLQHYRYGMDRNAGL